MALHVRILTHHKGLMPKSQSTSSTGSCLRFSLVLSIKVHWLHWALSQLKLLFTYFGTAHTCIVLLCLPSQDPTDPPIQPSFAETSMNLNLVLISSAEQWLATLPFLDVITPKALTMTLTFTSTTCSKFPSWGLGVLYIAQRTTAMGSSIRWGMTEVLRNTIGSYETPGDLAGSLFIDFLIRRC